MKEMLETLSINCENRFIDRVVVFYEGVPDTDTCPSLAHTKVTLIPIDFRPTYTAFFDYCSSNLSGEVCIVTNSDIYFDNNIEYVCCINYDNMMIALTRYDKWPGDDYRIRNTSGSYDTYIFRSPLPSFDSNIHMGILGCDSYLVQKALDAGIRVINPCLNITSYHKHFTTGGGNLLPDGSSYWGRSDYRGVVLPMVAL